jgi:hypothetical protein
MKYLFIGGEADGQRIDADHTYREVRVPIRQYIMVPMNPDDYAADATGIKYEIYRREVIHFGPGDRIEFFVHADLSPLEAMERLLAHYAPTL